MRDKLNLGNLLPFSSALILVLENSSLEFRCLVGDGGELPVADPHSFSKVASRASARGLAYASRLVLQFSKRMEVAHSKSPVNGTSW